MASSIQKELLHKLLTSSKVGGYLLRKPKDANIPMDSEVSAQLADFASFVINSIWHSSDSPALLKRSAFRKFIEDILRKTRVSISVVILALRYVRRLKESSPSISGADGSEYRLALVSLILAAKFLDDNTYTNGAWAEVCSLMVGEVNLMEREFLAGVQYRLNVTEEEYSEWLHYLEMFIPVHSLTGQAHSTVNRDLPAYLLPRGFSTSPEMSSIPYGRDFLQYAPRQSLYA